MKARFTLFAALVASIFVFSTGAMAQTASWNYTYTSGASSPIDMTGATVLAAGADDAVRNVTLPFTFQVYDDVFTTSSILRLSTNGFLGFITTVSQLGNSTRYIDTIPTALVQSQYVRGDFLSFGGYGDAEVIGNIMQKTTGSAPNRIFTLQFNYFPDYSASMNMVVQISFYETTNQIVMDYSSFVAGVLPAGVGKHIGINVGDGIYGTHCGNIPTSAAKITLSPGASLPGPVSLSATKISSSQINLVWQKNASNNDVIVTYNTTNTFQAPTAGVSYANGAEIAAGKGWVLTQGSATSHNHINLAPNQVYYYRVWSKNSSNLYSVAYQSANATTDPVNDPSSFVATGVSVSQVNLSWALNSASDNVIITYNTSNDFTPPVHPNNYTVGNEIAPGLGRVLYKGNGTSTTHSGLLTNKIYYYKVWSYNGLYYYSTPGVADTAKTHSAVNPSNLTAAATTTCNINVSWQKNANGNSVMVLYDTVNTFATPTTGQNYSAGYSFGVGQGTVLYSGSATSASHTPVNDNKTYYYKAFSYDGSYNYSTGITGTGATNLIADPTNFLGSASSTTQIDLSWTKNLANDNVVVLTNSSSNFGNLVDGTTYNTGASLGSGLGTVIYNGSLASFNHSGLTVNTTYHYKIASYDCAKNYSYSVIISASTSNVGNPTLFTATPSTTCTMALSWVKDGSNSVMVVSNIENIFGTPNNTTTYAVGSTIPGGGTVIYVGSGTTASHTPILDDTTYYYKAYSYSASHYYSGGVAAQGNTALIADPNNFAGTATTTQIDLSWLKNSANDNVLLIANDNPNFGNLIDGNNYNVGDALGSGLGTVMYKGSLLAYTHTGLSVNTTKYYRIVSFDCAKNYSDGAETTVTTGSVQNPLSVSFGTVNSCSVTLNWQKNAASNDVMVAFNYAPIFGTPINGFGGYSTGYSFPGGQGTVVYIGNATNFIHSPLYKSTPYYYKVWSKDGSNYFSTGLGADTTTSTIAAASSFTSTPISTSQINLGWSLNGNSDSVMVVSSSTGVFQNPIDGQVYTVNGAINGQGTVSYKGKGTSFNHTGLLVNTTYYYRIYSFDCNHNYSALTATSATTNNVENPASFVATGTGASQVNLNWTKNASNNDVIIVYNLTGTFSTPVPNTPYSQGGTIGTDLVIYKGPATTFNHNGLSGNTEYHYKIWSVTSANLYSNGLVDTANTTGVNPPIAFDATAVNASKIHLTWTPNTASDSVIITYNTVNTFVKPNDGTVYPVNNQILLGKGTVIYRGNGSAITSFDHLGLNSNTKYYYTIWSYNSADYYSQVGLLDSATTNFPGISSFPHITDFETQTSTTGNPACNGTYLLTTDWVNVTGDDKDWIPRTGSGQLSTTGPAGDHTTNFGSGLYVYTSGWGGGTCFNMVSYLVSPLYNFTALGQPKIEFYYHMYGNTMGRVALQVSTDGGATWSSDIWYKQGQQQTSKTAAWGYADVDLAAYAGMSNLKLRLKSTSGSSYYTDMAIDDIKVYQPQNMSITSVTTEQDTLSVVLGTGNQQVIRVKVETVGAFSPLTLTSFNFNTTGTTLLSDISNAKVYYTGNQATFSTTQQIGTTLATPTATFTMNASKVLAEGVNYFWLSFDIPSYAVIGDNVDAGCTQVTIASVNHTPTVTAPTPVKKIVGQIIVGVGTANTYNGPIYPPFYEGAHEAIYLSSELGALPLEINRLEWYKASGTNVVNKIDQISIYMKSSSASTLSDGMYSLTGYTLVYTGPMPNNKTSGWLGVNLSNTFLYDGTNNIHVLVLQTKPATTWNNYPYWNYSTTSGNLSRRAFSTSTISSLTATNQRPNARFEYVYPAPMVYLSSTTQQPNVGNVPVGATNQEIIRVKIETQYTGSPLSATSFTFNTLGTTAVSDISSAKVYYTGTSAVFSTATAFGTAYASPSGAFTITGSQALNAGTNYFWLAYNVSSSATINNVLDASCNAITVGGTPRTPTVYAPVGNRKIKDYITVGTGTSGDQLQPLHYVGYHSWEGIYLQTELGSAKDLSALAFYKVSGANISNDVLNVAIYMRHTTATTKVTGALDETGYVEVFNGSFPNDAVSGWQEVALSQVYSYNGTDNLEILVKQAYGVYIANSPMWGYTTTSSDRSRFASNFSGYPNPLTQSNKLANVRLEFSTPTSMTFVSSTSTQSFPVTAIAGIDDQVILGVNVVTSNSANPLSATSFTFNTIGSDNPSVDISKARVYYTGNSNTFAATNPFGTEVTGPNGTFTITGSQALVNGINYFWLVYDIPSTATTGNQVDAQCTLLKVAGVDHVPTVTNPIGDRTIVGALSGIYTIGATGDYTTFNNAVTALNTYGVSGWVKFKVQSGTYNEKIILLNVPTASATRTITFEAATGDSSSVILSYGASVYNDASTIKIDGGKYYIIQKMTIQGTGAYAHAIEIAGSASNNIIRNNRLVSTSTSTTYGATVYSYPGINNTTQIVNNLIEGAASAFYLRGNSTTSHISAWSIDSNIIKANLYGIYFYYADNMNVRANQISLLSTGNNFYGLYIGYSTSPYNISENRITAGGSNYSYGMYFNNLVGNSTQRVRIFNNFIVNNSNANNGSYGVYNTYSSYLGVYFNNFNSTSTLGANRSNYFENQGSFSEILNNNFISPGGGFCQYYYTTSNLTANYNNMVSTGSVGYYNGSAYTTLANWQASTGQDANSISINPNYTSTTDLHVSNYAMDKKGTPVSGISNDIDGASRNATVPDIGADEFGSDLDAGITALVSPVSPLCGSGSQSVSVTLKNYGLVNLTSASINWKVNGVTQTVYPWTGNLAPGATANITIGTATFGVGTVSFASWTTLPNGTADQFTSNDSVVTSVQVGNYPTANAGSDASVCSNSYTISGASATNQTSLNWLTTGTGSFTNGSTLTPTYSPSAADFTTGSVQLILSVDNVTCGNDKDTMVLTISQPATASFTGLATSYCRNTAPVTLSGSPAGGSFSGPGISGNVFNPATANIGANTIKYGYSSGLCHDTASQVVTVNALPTVDLTGIASTYCNNANIVTLTGTPAGGTFGGPGVTGNTFNPALIVSSPAMVWYSYTNASTSCSNADTVTVTVNAAPTANAGTDQTIPFNTSTTLSGSAIGGSGSYAYSWTPTSSLVNATVQNPTTTPIFLATNFTLNVIDNSTNCFDVDEMTVNVTAPVLITFATATPDTVCSGNPVQLGALTSGGTGVYVHSWTSNPAGFTSSLQNPIVNPTVSAWYKVYVTSGTLNAQDSIFVTVNPTPVASFSGLPTYTCTSASIINLTGTPMGGTYSGSGVVGNTFNPQTVLVGTYPVTYSYTNAQGCQDTSIRNVTVQSAPVVNAGSDQSITSGTSTLLGATTTGGSGNFAYGWSPSALLLNAAIQNPTTVALSTTTTFTATVTDNLSGCTDVDDMVVTVSPGAFAVNVTATPATICAGSSSQLLVTPTGGSGTYTYSWTSSPVGFTSALPNPVVTPTVTTTYYVVVNDGANSVNGSIMVTVNPLPVVSFTGLNADYCQGEAASTLVGTPAGGTFSGPGISGNTFNPSTANIGNNSIVYAVSVASCSNSSTQIAVLHQTPIANAGTDVILPAPGITTLNGSSVGGANKGYSWTPAALLGNSHIANPTTVTLNSTTIFTLQVSDTIYGCASSDQMTVTVLGVPISVVASALPTTICSGSTSNLSSQASGGNVGTYSYLWSSIPSGFTSTNKDVTVSPTVTTTYTIRATDNMDTAFYSVVVTVTPLPNPNIVGLGSDYCNNGSSISLTATPSGGTFSGPGVTGTTFNPASANVGSNAIVYTVTVNSCTNTDTQYVAVWGAPVANAGTDQSLTGPGTTTLNGSSTGGVNVGYAWSPISLVVNPNQVVTLTQNLTSSTLFTLEAKDTLHNCASTDQVQINVGGGPLVTTVSATPSTICKGYSTTISVTASGATGTYTYSWTSVPSGFTSNQATASVSPLVTTTYTVNVVSGSFNQSKNVVVTVNPLPVVSFSGLTTPVCANSASMTLNGLPSGGSFAGTGVVQNMGVYTFDPTIAGNGNFDIIYNYTHPTTGCYNADTQQVVVNQVPVANAGANQIISVGSTTLNGSATLAGNYKFLWTPSSLVTNATNATTTTVSLSTSQIFTLKVTDSITSCNSSDAVQITVQTTGNVVANASATPTTICSGETSQLNVLASGGTGIYTYQWSSVPAGFTSTIQNPVVSPALNTNYYVTVSDGNSQAVTSVGITVNASPTATFTGLDASYCLNGIVDTLTGIPAGGYFSGNGMSSNLFNPSTAGMGSHAIVYAYTSTNGCTASDTIFTQVYANPVANAGLNDTVLVNHQEPLYGQGSGGTGSYNFYWSPASMFANANLQNNLTNAMTLTQLFTLTVEDQTTLCSGTDDVLITVNGGPLTLNPTATPDTICAGQQVQLFANAGGGTGTYMFAWTSNPSGYIQTVANPIAQPNVTTEYIVNVFDGVSVKTDTVKVVVGVIPNVIFTSGNTQLCSNGALEQLAATPSGGVFLGNGVSGNTFNPTVAGVGSHDIIYNYTSPLGCTNSDTVTMNVQPIPTADAGADIVIPCNGTGGLIGSNSVANMTYYWSPSQGLAQPTMSSTIANPTTSTHYTILVTNTITGCSNTDFVNVTVNGGPTIVVSNDTMICGGEDVVISVTGDASSYLWSNGVSTNAFMVAPNANTTYYVTATGSTGCATLDSVKVMVNAPSIFLGPDVVLLENQSITLDAGYGFADYQWNTGDTTQAIVINVYVNALLGQNMFKVEVMDAYGCMASDSVLIRYLLDLAELSNDQKVEIYPNPSNDRVTLSMVGIDLQNASIEIVNTQGQVVESRMLHTSNVSHDENIEVSTWPTGIYFVIIKTQQGNVVKKLVVQ